MLNTQHKTNTLSTWDNHIVVDTQTCKIFKKRNNHPFIYNVFN